ncbi:MAG TPA: hypothetical protein VE971_04985 [Candidatus Eisenbacteria bacterium]|nr:hypothetical protein [Candidatus Eisenbacteria bacterium]
MILETVKKRGTSNSKDGISDREICFVIKDEIKATIRKGMESNLIYIITF